MRRFPTLGMLLSGRVPAQAFAAAAGCRAWNVRMKEEGGPAQPSPSIRAALNGGHGFLRVQCSGCKQRAYIDLALVKRRPGTAIWTLEGALACRPCRNRNRRAPRATLERLSRESRFVAGD
jgi:hypothetical protein